MTSLHPISVVARAVCGLVLLSTGACLDLPGDSSANGGSGTATHNEGAPLGFSIDVDLGADGEGSSETLALPFSTGSRTFTLTIESVGAEAASGESFSGCLTVHLTTGVLEATTSTLSSPSCPSGTLAVAGGSGSGTVTLSRAYDALRIWLSDEGDDATPGSFATGSSDAIFVRHPTVAQVQESDSAVESPLERHYVPMLGWNPELPEKDRRELIVTTVTNDGFYITDRSDDPGTYNSLFVFSFSRPEDIEVGDRLKGIAGIVAEFLGFTELQFPTWEIESRGHDPGEVSVLDPDIVCEDSQMEAWEASVIRLDNLSSDITRLSDCEDLNEYGQWPATLPGTCGGSTSRVNVVNINTVPSFTFPECDEDSVCRTAPAPDWCFEPRHLDYLVGLLRHTQYANPPWILEVRDCLDFPEADRPEDCEDLLLEPMSGPRLAPRYERRDVPSCVDGTLP